MVAEKKRKTDWRTNPRDEFRVELDDGSFVSFSWAGYLVDQWPRGHGWNPGHVVSRAWKLHDTPRDKRGHLSGIPRLRETFVNWLDGKTDKPISYSHAQVAEALRRVKARNMDAYRVLEWRQRRGPHAELHREEFMATQHIASTSTLTKRLYVAAALALEEVERMVAGGADV